MLGQSIVLIVLISFVYQMFFNDDRDPVILLISVVRTTVSLGITVLLCKGLYMLAIATI